MKCEEINDRLFDLCEGNFSTAEEERAFLQHTQQCAACSAQVAETKKFLAQLAKEKQEESNPYLAEKTISQLKRPARPVFYKAALRVAVVLIIGAGTGILLNTFLQPPQEEIVSANPAEETSEDILGSDNSILTLNE